MAYARSFDEVPSMPFDPQNPTVLVRSGRKFRGHLFGEGEFQISDETALGFQLQTTTDDTYLRRFDISQDDRLVSNLFYERYGGRGRTTYNAFYFQGLRAEDDNAQTPIVPALIEHRSVFRDPLFGGDIAIDANVLSLFRTEGADNDIETNGRDTQRFSVSGTWTRPFTSRMGDVITASAHIRGDYYSTTNREFDFDGDMVVDLNDADIEEGRLLGYVALDWRWPFVRGTQTTRQVIEPIVQVIWSPEGGNPIEIPNEDSISFEFDDTNLFALNKTTGLDRFESGTRANVGFRLAHYGETVSAGFLFGQTYRMNDTNAFAEGSGIENEISDYVGRLTVEANKWLTLRHRFRLDKDGFDFKRNEFDIDLDTKRIGLRAGYLSTDDDESIGGPEARQEIRMDGRVNFTENWYFRAGARRDLEDGEMISNYAGLVYEDECTTIEANYKRTFTSDRDIEPSTAIFFRIRLRSVGS
jgi:LPS-assembly protein